MKKMADDFTNLYQVSKTLRFELKPVGRTLEYMQRDGIIDEDSRRAEDYKKVKEYIDRYHKAFINRVLSTVELSGLEDFEALYHLPKDPARDQKLSAAKAALRKQIVKALKGDATYKILDKKELIRDEMPAFGELSESEKETVKSFREFTSYFTGFYRNRENMYSEEEKSTAIAYRLINQNLPKYLDNRKVYETAVKAVLSGELAEMKENYRAKLPEADIECFFTLDGFQKTLTQKGIDQYNAVLGGYTEGEKKIQGLNEYINLHNQQLKNGEKRIPKLKPLFKQILSDREDRFSFVPEGFDDDAELLNAIRFYTDTLAEEIFENEARTNVWELLTGLHDYDTETIYIENGQAVSLISQKMTGDWSAIQRMLIEHYDAKNDPDSKKRFTQKYVEKREKELKKKKSYTIVELDEALTERGCDGSVEAYYALEADALQRRVAEAGRAFAEIQERNSGSNLKKKEHETEIIKAYLDSLKELQRLLKPLLSGQDEGVKDEIFYAELVRIMHELEPLTGLYNKVRNYVTKKPYSMEKIKLNFGKSTLLDGWDKNKERDNLGVIFVKEGKYYLGIMNRKDTGLFENAPGKSNDVYKKMDYKLLPGANKMLPKVFFSEKRLDQFKPSDQLLERYKKKHT